MDALLLSTSIVGCSVSILFSVSTVVVLSCYREKTRPLRMKQHFSIALVLTNTVILAGFQGLSDEAGCRVVTILLHYAVTVSFAWITLDIYYVTSTLRKKILSYTFSKMAIAVWTIPIPFVGLALILGLALDSKIGSSSKAYCCWESDHIVWALVIPCGLAFLISCHYLIVGAYVSYYQNKELTNASDHVKRSAEASRYGLKTNFVMLIITTLIWIFGCQTFWHPDTVNFQLVFGLGTGIQGLFLFFFYCVFCLELDLYVNDNIRDDFSEKHQYKDLENVKIETYKRKQSTNKSQETNTLQSTKELTKEENQEKNPPLPELKEALPLNPSPKHEEEELLPNTQDQSKVDNEEFPERMVIVHKPEEQKKDADENSLETRSSILDVEPSPGNEANTSSDDTNSHNFEEQRKESEKTESPEVERKYLHRIHRQTPSPKLHHSEPIESPIETPPQKSSPIISENSDSRKKKTSVQADRSASTASVASILQGNNRRTSRTSNLSYASNMGLNELESLFNNPDLMNQALPNRSSWSSSNRTDRTSQESNRRRASPSTIPTHNNYSFSPKQASESTTSIRNINKPNYTTNTSRTWTPPEQTAKTPPLTEIKNENNENINSKGADNETKENTIKNQNFAGQLFSENDVKDNTKIQQSIPMETVKTNNDDVMNNYVKTDENYMLNLS